MPVSLNVVNFHYTRPHLNDEAHDGLNKQIEVELQEQGAGGQRVTKESRIEELF